MNKKFLSVLLLFFIALFIVVFLGDKFAKEKGFSGLWSLLSTSASNYPKSFDVEPEKLHLDLSDKNFAKLLKVVEQARATGVIHGKGNKFRKARLTYNGKVLETEVRIKGKLTDHVKNDKWSFRVKVKGDEKVMGMKRFSLQHPGTRNYANEWVFHQMAKRESMVALRYKFVELHLNGQNLGVYAMEEHFGQELLQYNQRPPGPILRFDPGLYWQHRLNEMNDVRVLEEYAEFTNSNIDTYTEGTVFEDSNLTTAFYRAQYKLEAFRSGRLPLDSVFKVESLARYHALIDLIGGHHSMDWSDVKYYFNPTEDLLEPVAYESFSVFPTRELAGSYRFTGRANPQSDLHNALFSNEQFFRAYMQALRRIAQKDYLDELFSDIDTALHQELAVLYAEFPYKEFSTKQYYKNAETINVMLDTPEGFHAYMQKLDSAEGAVRVTIRTGMIESLPFEIVGFRTSAKDSISCADIDLPMAQRILPAKARRVPVPIKDVEFELPARLAVDLNDMGGWRVYYRLLGDDVVRKATVLPYAYLPDSVLSTVVDPVPLDSIATLQPGSAATWNLKKGKHKVSGSINVPIGTKLVGGPGIGLEFGPSGALVVEGNLVLRGNEDNPIHIHSNGQGTAIRLVGNGHQTMKGVLFTQIEGSTLVELKGGHLSLKNCRAVLKNGTLLRANSARLTSNGNIFVTSTKTTVLELNASRSISNNDRRIGDGLYAKADLSFLECTNFNSDEPGELLKATGSEAVFFTPKLVSGEHLSALENSVLEFRNMDKPSKLISQVDGQSKLTVNGSLLRSQELVEK